MRAEERNRRAVSVEHLLHWAYAAQMVHAAQRGPIGMTRAAAPLAATSSVWSEGSPVQSSRKEGFEAADDAWRVHDQVMKLGAIKVDCGQDLAAARYHVLGQYRGAEPPIGGAGVDNTARGATTARPWPTNGLLDIDVRMLVIIHASKETRPHQFQPDFRMKPGPVVRHPKQTGGIYKLGWYCHVSAFGDLPGDAVQACELYRAWYHALAHVRAALAVIPLTMFAVTEVMPPPPQKPRLSA